jgi:hypothetical protein
MKILVLGLLLGLVGASSAWGLTPEEVIKLKKAGVSDATIQMMLEQEKSGGSVNQGPVEDTGNEVIYRAGQNTKAQAERNARHEAWKEKKSLEAVGGVIIDKRHNN